MKVEVLGPLLVSGKHISPRERTALAAIAVRRGRFVEADEIAEAIWGEDLPPTWRKQVQISVGRLRKHLGADRIETAGSSYALRLADDELDLALFESLVDTARHRAALGDHERAASSFRGALALWRGVPYGDIAAWPPAADESSRLSEVRRTAEEEFLQARLDAGLHRSVVADAETLVRQDPRRERRWAMLATALYRSGRQQDALSVLREAHRRILADGLDPGEELSDLEGAVLRHDESLELVAEPTPATQECPYRGLAAFDASDVDEYFGREQETAAALDRLLAGRLLVLAGPSGCGKSSLARAGLMPAVVARGLAPAVVTPGSGGVSALRVALAGTSRDVVVVDQFEELFSGGTARPEWDEYATALADFAATGGMVVLTVRSDFLDRCAALPGISARLSESIQFVTTMGETGIRQAIEEPARLAGLRVEPGLTELILRDVRGEAAALPHMSHALVETWVRREGRVLTVEGYQACGGISGAIAQSAEELFQQLDAAQRLICRTVLTRLVDLSPDGVSVRRRALLTPLSADRAHHQLLQRLSEARLISIEAEDVVLAHESLALAWPRLRGWLEEDVAGTRIVRALTIAADDWAGDGEAAADLFRGGRLQTTLEWRDRTHAQLTPAERRFLDASAAFERHELDALAEQARTERRRSRRLRGLLVAAILLLCLSVVAGLLAIGAQRRSAERGRVAEGAQADAEFTSLVATSVALRGSQRDVAALLAAEAYRRRPDDPRARNALMATLVAAGGFLGTSYAPDTAWVVGSAAGSTSLLVDDDGKVGVYDSATLRPRQRLSLDGAPELDLDSRPLVAMTPDAGEAVVAFHTADPGGTWVAAFDLATGAMSSVSLPFAVGRIALAPGGDEAAVLDVNGDLHALDLESGFVGGQGTQADAVSYTAHDHMVATRADGSVLFDDHLVARVPPDAVGGPIAVAGSTVVTSGAHLIEAVSLRSGRVVWSQTFAVKLSDECAYIAASLAAGSVFCGDDFGRIQRRDLETGQVTANLDRQLGAVGELIVSGDGTTLTAVGGAIPAVSRWRLDGAGAVTRIVSPDRVVIGYRGSTDQVLVAKRPPDIVNWDDFKQFQLWNVRTDVPVGPVIRGDSFGWVGPDTVQGVFEDTGAIGYLDVGSEERYPGRAPLRPDAQLAVPDQSGAHVYITYPDGRIDTLDPRTGAEAGPTMHVDGYPLSVSPNRDDSMLAVAVAGTSATELVVLDTVTGNAVSHREVAVEAVAFAPDGDLYGASETGRVSRFSLPTLAEVAALPGARGWVNSLQFSRDGSLLLVTANDATVSLYDLGTGMRLGDPITSEAPGIIPGVLKPDGTELLVSVTEGVAAWNLDPEAQLAAVCRIAGRQLTEGEWHTYLAGLGSYRATCPSE